jgi:integrase
MKLTVPFVGKAQPGRHGDGGGLYLLVKPDGRRTWVFRYRDRTTRKLRDKGLGAYPDVKLAEARQLASECRSQLRQGEDPIASRRAAMERAQAERGKQVTFGECAARYIAANEHSWRNAKHAEQWRSTINTYCSSLLKLPVSQIDTALVQNALHPIWQGKTETAVRLRGRIERILDWATVSNFRSGDNPARWKGNLKHLLPPPEKLKKVQHRPALPYDDIPDFMRKLKVRHELSALALQLQLLTATRPGEAVGAKWSEFDLGKSIWTIPAARTKTHEAHEVPLSKHAIALLKKVPNTGKEHLFPGKSGRSIVTAAPLKLLRSIAGAETQTCHGFRSTFRDWAADKTSHGRDIIEMSLAHKILSRTEAAYHRSTMLPKRAALMADWGNYCHGTVERRPR